MNQVSHSEVRADKSGVTETQKMSAIRTLAIVGFLAMLVLLVWLAVAIVRHIPEGFSTLASLIESMSSPTHEFSLDADKTTVGSDEMLHISWTTTREVGVYGFTYACADGVSALLTVAGQDIPLSCDSWSTLPQDADDGIISFTSATQRYVDVTMKIRFTPEDGSAVSEKTQRVTVVNEAIADVDTSEPVLEPEAPATTTPDTPKPVAPKPTGTIKVPYTTMTYPTSDPQGYTDLAVSFIGVGTYNRSSKNFSSRSSLDNDEDGALRFEVKNIGTKTSTTWAYTAELPVEGDETFHSPLQTPLLPQERAVITILLEDIRERSGNATIEVEVEGGSDTRTSNNDFERTVRIEN